MKKAVSVVVALAFWILLKQVHGNYETIEGDLPSKAMKEVYGVEAVVRLDSNVPEDLFDTMVEVNV